MAIEAGLDANKKRPSADVWVVARDASGVIVHGPAKLTQLNWDKPGWYFIAKFNLKGAGSLVVPKAIGLKEPPFGASILS